MSFQRNKTDISRFKSFKHGSDKGNEAHPQMYLKKNIINGKNILKLLGVKDIFGLFGSIFRA
uniref:Uncharacterized protein n=1 Tax=Meloidogyne hapla TaxID=6305 RepID=A0A1I8BZ72_MELHA